MKGLNEERSKLKRGIQYTFAFVSFIWLVKIIETLSGIDFGGYGILPRTFEGSAGILLAPLIHGDFYHLLSNTFPIIILGLALFYFYDKIAISVVLLVYMMTGFWVWMAARDAYHIGASGLVYGLLTFILFSGFFRRDKNALAISFILLVIYGGSFFYGIIPNKPGISWESHLMGAIAGIFCAVYYRKYKVTSQRQEELSIEQPAYIYSYQEASKQKKKVLTYNYTVKIDKSNSTK